MSSGFASPVGPYWWQICLRPSPNPYGAEQQHDHPVQERVEVVLMRGGVDCDILPGDVLLPY